MEAAKRITITRALAELKLLDSRILKKSGDLVVIDIYQNRKDLALRTGDTKDVFIEKAKSSLQSVKDLIERRKKIKSAILISNATVKVKIGDIEYAVIEAIERKISIKYDQNLLNKMRKQVVESKGEISNQAPKLDQDIKDMINKSLAGDQPTAEENKANEEMANRFLEANVLRLLDPCEVEKQIDELDEQIDTFLTEIDFVLSESNSRTKIEV